MIAKSKMKRIAFGSTAFSAAMIVSALYAAAPATQTASAPNLVGPMATSPLVSRKNIVAVPYQPVIPPTVVSHDPRVLKSDVLHPLRAGPAVDVPPLATVSAPLPAETVLPASPAIRLASPDLSALPVGSIAAKADAGLPTIQTDPTSGLLIGGALVITPPPRIAPPPAQLLSIPDPSHQPGFIRTPSPAREDAPVTNLDRPSPTTLPAGK